MGRFWNVFVGLMLAMSAPTIAEETNFSFGGDVFGGSESVDISLDVANDVFAAGNNVNITGNVSGDVHAVGTNVLVQRNVEGNIYVGGGTVQVLGSVGRDVLAGGNNVAIVGNEVGGNVRLMGQTVKLNSAVTGNVLIGAANATLNATIQGDFTFGGESLTFGENAKILGNVIIKGPTEIEVPASVASAERVTFIQANEKDIPFRVDNAANGLAWSFWPSFIPGFAVLIVGFLVGVIWLALMPDRSTMAYMVSQEKPFKSLFVGVLGLSTFFGLLIVLGITLIGIPLIPIAIFMLVLVWIIGYVSGAYFLTARIIEAFGQRVESLGVQVLALIAGLALAWVLGLAPFIGWFSQLALIFFGIGALGLAMVYRRTGSPYHTLLHDRLKAG